MDNLKSTRPLTGGPSHQVLLVVRDRRGLPITGRTNLHAGGNASSLGGRRRRQERIEGTRGNCSPYAREVPYPNLMPSPPAPLRTHLPRLSPVTRIKGRFPNAGVRCCMDESRNSVYAQQRATPAYLHSRRPERHTTYDCIRGGRQTPTNRGNGRERDGSLWPSLLPCRTFDSCRVQSPTSAGGGLQHTATGPRLDRR